MAQDEPRLRPRPEDRFEGVLRLVDLEQAFRALPAESVSRQGRVQKTLYRRGPMTVAIFEFQEGASLDAYVLDGDAILHVIAGRLRVGTDAGAHEVGAGQLLLLDPGVGHDVEALQPTRLLMTVILEGDPPADATGRVQREP